MSEVSNFRSERGQIFFGKERIELDSQREKVLSYFLRTQKKDYDKKLVEKYGFKKLAIFLECLRNSWFYKDRKKEEISDEEIKNIYTDVLRVVKKQEKGDRKNLFPVGSREDLDIELLRHLTENTIDLEKNMSEEQKEKFRRDFPSGNYLYYGAFIDDFAEILKSGQVMSSDELKEMKGLKHFGHAGQGAPCFSLNEIYALPGTTGHLTGLLFAPEGVLDEKTQLQVPLYRGAVSEVRLHVKPEVQDTSDKKLYARADVSNAYVVVNSADLFMVRNFMATNDIRVKGILTFSSAQIRDMSFPDYSGDHKELTDTINRAFKQAHLAPSISWRKLLKNKFELRKGSRFVHSTITRDASCIMKEGDSLKVVDTEDIVYERSPKPDMYDGIID